MEDVQDISWVENDRHPFRSPTGEVINVPGGQIYEPVDVGGLVLGIGVRRRLAYRPVLHARQNDNSRVHARGIDVAQGCGVRLRDDTPVETELYLHVQGDLRVACIGTLAHSLLPVLPGEPAEVKITGIIQYAYRA